MTKAIVTVAACATLLCAGTALALTPQQKCDSTRIAAWAKYVSCVDAVVTKDAKGIGFDEFAAFAKCRHGYFKKWATLQTTSFATSTCAVGLTNRFTDNGTTVTDNLSGLVWEKKTGTVGGGTDSNPENVNNYYSWSTGSPYNGNGTAFTTFIGALDGFSFAGTNDWWLPTLAELQTIVKDFACTGAGNGSTCTCRSLPCIDGTFGPTQSYGYWSATSYVPFPHFAWDVDFDSGDVDNFSKDGSTSVRAVRGGL
jgi:hypothetical protein